jgi:hypothetical protein
MLLLRSQNLNKSQITFYLRLVLLARKQISFDVPSTPLSPQKAVVYKLKVTYMHARSSGPMKNDRKKCFRALASSEPIYKAFAILNSA